MKNVTITLPDDVAAWARVEAAKQGRSLSRYVAELLAESRSGQVQRQEALSHQREALERFLAGPDLPLSEDGRLPTKEELYAERVFHRHERSDLRARPAGSAKAGEGG
jgi:plasmid stability protein